MFSSRGYKQNDRSPLSFLKGAIMQFEVIDDAVRFAVFSDVLTGVPALFQSVPTLHGILIIAVVFIVLGLSELPLSIQLVVGQLTLGRVLDLMERVSSVQLFRETSGQWGCRFVSRTSRPRRDEREQKEAEEGGEEHEWPSKPAALFHFFFFLSLARKKENKKRKQRRKETVLSSTSFSFIELDSVKTRSKKRNQIKKSLHK